MEDDPIDPDFVPGSESYSDNDFETDCECEDPDPVASDFEDRLCRRGKGNQTCVGSRLLVHMKCAAGCLYTWSSRPIVNRMGAGNYFCLLQSCFLVIPMPG